MTTIDTVLRRSLEGRGGDFVLTLDGAFQGLPETAHGGSVLAAFDALADLTAPRAVSGVYRKRVPLGTPLRLAVGRDDGAHTFVLRDKDSVLVDGRVAPAADDGGPVMRHPLGERRIPGAGHSLPLSHTCFACGVDNPLGLRVRLEFDESEVRGAWEPRENFRAAGGALATAALTTLLDEAAFWLGALASGESGMTTDLRVSLGGPVPFGAALVVRGDRAAVRPHPDDGRYWDTEVVAATADGRPVASARVTFVAVRGAARRLVTGLLAMNDPDVLRRVFPAYVPARA